MGEPQPVKISLTPKPGVEYIDGFSSQIEDPAVVSIWSEAISNNTSITNETTVIYIDYEGSHYRISVGSIFSGVYGHELSFMMEVIGFNHDVLSNPNAYGKVTKTGRAGITFCTRNIANTLGMNSSNTNVGGWKESNIRSSSLPELKNVMVPPDFRYDVASAIKPVNKLSGLGGGSSSGVETTSDDLFLLSEVEVFGSTTYSVPGEGTQYAYYKAGNSKVREMQGSAAPWWLRSPYPGNSDFFCRVYSNGNANFTNASNSCGVAFAFCI